MKKLFITLLLIRGCVQLNAQNNEVGTSQIFEKKLFEIENAYYDGKLDYTEYENALNFHTNRIIQLANANKEKIKGFEYLENWSGISLVNEQETDKVKLLLNWAIYSYITDTNWFKQTNGAYFIQYPMVYADNDPFGKINWKTTMVSNLIRPGNECKNQGNCFSLAALYYILSQRLHSDAYLCTAPNHIYIQHKGFDGNYYNIELGSQSFPGSGSIKTYTYTTHQAVQSGIAMRRLNEKEAIALCFVQLAEGYKHKVLFNKKYDHFFILKCAEQALKYDSLCLSAMLLKTEFLEKNVLRNGDNDSIGSQELKNNLLALNKLGYREMPLQEIVLTEVKNKTIASPFSTIDKREEYYTLSNNQFEEVPANSNQYAIGDFKLDLERDMLTYSNHASNLNAFDPVMFALSIDPLAAEFPSESPYSGMGNNPVNMVDPDGKKYSPGTSYGYKSKIALKWIDYLRVFHADEYTNQDFYDMYLVYKNAGYILEDAIESNLLVQIKTDIESGRFLNKRSLQMNAFREKRKRLVPIETLVPPIVSEEPHYIEYPEDAVTEMPEFLKFLDQLDAPLGLELSENNLDFALNQIEGRKQHLENSIEGLTSQIETYKRTLDIFNNMKTEAIKPSIAEMNRIITEKEAELEKQKKELKNTP